MQSHHSATRVKAQAMNQELWKTFDKLRTLPFSGSEGLAEFFQKEGVRFSPSDLGTWGQFFAARFGRGAGTVHVPEWLAGMFGALAKDASPESICDPWAGTGFLVEVLREACQPKEALAFTQNQAEHDLGKVLVPEVSWQLGEPLCLLDAVTQEFDLVASILPMDARSVNPLTVATPAGEKIELRDGLGNLVMVAASLHLSSSGVGLFVVTPYFFFSQRSVFRQFGVLGLGVEAALALPSGTFAPYTNISAYLVVVRRKPAEQMFVAQLSGDEKTNLQILDNLRQGREGGTLELGRFVAPLLFTSLETMRTSERFDEAESRFAAPAIKLAELATAINLGRFGDDFAFQPQDNSLFIPLIGNSEVMDSLSDLTLKKQNYAQVVIDPARSNARFVARFLNSDFGKELREQSKTGAVIPKLNKQTLKDLCVFVPDLQTQRRMLEIEARMTAEQNTLLGLQNELGEFRRELWANPRTADNVEGRLSLFSKQLGGGLKKHAADTLEQWFDSLPFPLASILRAWQATSSEDFKTKHDHLLYFFEATSEFFGVIMLSAFASNEAFFAAHKQKLAEAMKKGNVSFQRASFGTWKVVVEYLGKQMRGLLSESGKNPEDAQNDRAICKDLFADLPLALIEALSCKGVAEIISTTCNMRNKWRGHGGVVGQEEARVRNEQLIGEVQKLRDAIADAWVETQLIRVLKCYPRPGMFENEVAILMGSHNDFLPEMRTTSTCLYLERLYLSQRSSGRALEILPLIQLGPSPQSAKNACYFFSRLDREGACFVSYHFADQPERKGLFKEAIETIAFLTQV
jgi:hypothetical protein